MKLTVLGSGSTGNAVLLVANGTRVLVDAGLSSRETARRMALMGEDFWPYGLESNRHTLETFVRYMYEQGLIPKPMTIETLFPDSTQRTFRV